MKITFYGHSAFGWESGGIHVLFDPFISPNEKAADISIDEIPADFILLSHGHADHVADVESIARRTGAKVVSNFEVIQWFASKGVENGHPMNHGGSWTFPFGKVKMVNAVHSSSMPDGSYGGNPAGFVVSTEEKDFYYAGDTALHTDMSLIGDEFDIDTAFLPIGDNFTMGIEDAVKAAKLVGASHVVAMHYDTFPYIEIDHAAAEKSFREANIKLSILSVGATLNL